MVVKDKSGQLVKMIYYWFLCLALGSGQHGRCSTLKQKLVQKMDGNKNTAVSMAIYGRIAGVGFRSWLRQRARLNQLDSLVFYRGLNVLGAVLVGPPEKIELVVREAWKGPSRARVYQIREKWFNSPELKSLEETRAGPARFRETIDILEQALEYLRPVMKKPNRFRLKDKYSNAGELARAAEERNLFTARLGNVSYIVSPQKHLGLQQSQSSRVSTLVRSLTDHKQLTKDYLASRGLPVPIGSVFTGFEKARVYLERCKHPLVVKPLEGSYGLGVSVDVRTARELRQAFCYARRYHEQVILEELVQGLDIRVLVIGGKARAALLRVPAHVVGDGRRSIEQLILRKNRMRFENPRLGKAPIIPDMNVKTFLARQGYSLESIPKRGEKIFLRLKANIGAGADSVLVTGMIHPDLMRLAEEAATALGVVDFWGVDLLVERIDQPRGGQRCVIIEVNSRANIFNVQFPLYGEPFDAARSLVDSLFPEESLGNAYPFKALKIEITGLLNPGFYARTSKLARKLALRGHIKPAGVAADAVVYGRKNQVLAFLDRLWGWREGSWIVDGFNLSAHTGMVGETFSIKRESSRRDRPAFLCGSSPGLEEALEQPCVFARSSRDGDGDEDEDVDINTRLFLKEFNSRGYSAEPIDGGLLKIRGNNLVGITNMHFSSLFCDKACGSIYPAKKMLALNGIPVLRGLRFKLSQMNLALCYFDILKGPCIITALHPLEPRSMLVRSRKELAAAWRKAVNWGTRYFIIEKPLAGRNICAAVVAGQFAGAQLLLPISLCGNGELTVSQLIEKKNEARSMNPWYRDRLLPDATHFKRHLDDAGYHSEGILPRGKKLMLECEDLMELGGESISLENYLHRDFKELSVQAIKAIPGLELAFVHMIIPHPGERAGVQQWAVTKIETGPAPACFHFPWRGKPFNLVGKIVNDLCLTERIIWEG